MESPLTEVALTRTRRHPSLKRMQIVPLFAVLALWCASLRRLLPLFSLWCVFNSEWCRIQQQHQLAARGGNLVQHLSLVRSVPDGQVKFSAQRSAAVREARGTIPALN